MTTDTTATNWPKILAIGCGVLLLLSFCCGLFSAIAIPNFTAYQERAAQGG